MTIAPATTPTGAPAHVTCRAAAADDHQVVATVLGRCSVLSLRSRFHPAVDHAAAAQWFRHALTTETSDVWVCESDQGPVALADASRAGTAPEVGLLVGDAWQRQGFGTLLLATVLTDLRNAGASAVILTTRTERLSFIRGLKRRLGLTATKYVSSRGETDVYLAIEKPLGVTDGLPR